MPLLSMRVRLESSSRSTSWRQRRRCLGPAPAPRSRGCRRRPSWRRTGRGRCPTVEHEARHVVARSRVRVDESHRLALEILDLLIGRFGKHIEDRIVALRAVAVDVDREGVGLDADDARAGERGRAVVGDLDVAGALALDDRGIIVGDAQASLSSRSPSSDSRRTASSGRPRPSRSRRARWRRRVRDISPSNPGRARSRRSVRQGGADHERATVMHTCSP